MMAPVTIPLLLCHVILYRFEFTKRAWLKDPEERPTFAEFVTFVDGIVKESEQEITYSYVPDDRTLLTPAKSAGLYQNAVAYENMELAERGFEEGTQPDRVSRVYIDREGFYADTSYDL